MSMESIYFRLRMTLYIFYLKNNRCRLWIYKLIKVLYEHTGSYFMAFLTLPTLRTIINIVIHLIILYLFLKKIIKSLINNLYDLLSKTNTYYSINLT